MNEFDLKAAGWDENPMHYERSKAVAEFIRRMIPLNKEMTALEFGAGTGITSMLLADSLREITMTDNSGGMVDAMNKRLIKTGLLNLKALHFDLEKDDYAGETVDLLFSQMVLHHIADVDSIIRKIVSLLNPGGYIAIADIYPEDGSFHGTGFDGHKGFDPEELSVKLRQNKFENIACQKCFTIRKEANGQMKEFDVFLLTGRLMDPKQSI